MKLWKEILARLLQEERLELHIPSAPSIETLFEKECFQILQKIKDILEDDSLTDADCFEKIEQIICIFEEHGTVIARHDFG